MAAGNGAGTRLPGSVRPELKVMVREACLALTQLNAARLEELAASCEALTFAPVNAPEARAAQREMAMLGRVLEATRANAEVMQRLRAMHAAGIEYSERQARGCV